MVSISDSIEVEETDKLGPVCCGDCVVDVGVVGVLVDVGAAEGELICRGGVVVVEGEWGMGEDGE